MAEKGYLPDDGFIVAFGNNPEIVTAADGRRLLHAGGCERIPRQAVDIVTEDHGFFTGIFNEAGEGGKGISLAEKGAEEGVVGGEGEVGQGRKF